MSNGSLVPESVNIAGAERLVTCEERGDRPGLDQSEMGRGIERHEDAIRRIALT
jgi:hypothetical protein